METATLSEASVYVGTYGKYNNGSLFGAWLDLSDYADKEEFYEACRELHKDEEDAEFMFQDWENVPEGLISESWISENFFTLRDAVEQLGDTEQEAFFVWCNYKSRDLSEEDADGAIRNRKPFSCGATTKAMTWAKRMRTTLLGTSKTSIKGSMTMKKISPIRLWKNATTCRSSQRPISIMKNLPVICSCALPVICSCAIIGLMTALYSGQLEKDNPGGVSKPCPLKQRN